jgi:hypothetical protein
MNKNAFSNTWLVEMILGLFTAVGRRKRALD